MSLASTSRAADAGFLTLADVSSIALGLGVDYRIVGGHMVTLLVAAYGVAEQVPMRETADADFAALPEVIADPRLPAELTQHGYLRREAANRFVRGYSDTHGPLDLVVDILAPSYRGKLVPNQRHGELVVDEIPGLALALHRPAMFVDVNVRLTGRKTSLCAFFARSAGRPVSEGPRIPRPVCRKGCGGPLAPIDSGICRRPAGG